jgi:pantoate--beta-alanine ligase
MITITTVEEMQNWSNTQRRNGSRIGLVPTMGALHDGHLTLVDAAKERCDDVVASVFVNPTQFAPNEDFDRYPRDLETDAARLAERGVTALFAPIRDQMYGSGFRTTVMVDGITQQLEGRTRPDHFAGVTLIVTKLFHAVRPDVAVFGRKDAQQALVIRRLVTDLDFGIEIFVAPTIREADGLAMSSRNRYLSQDGRVAALALSRALQTGCAAWTDGERNATTLVELMTPILESESLVRVDYLAIVSADTFKSVSTVDAGTLVAGAVYVGETRLIDNWWVDDADHAEF